MTNAATDLDESSRILLAQDLRDAAQSLTYAAEAIDSNHDVPQHCKQARIAARLALRQLDRAEVPA